MQIRMILASTLAVLALAFGGVLGAAAQDSALASAGFPELSVTLTDTGPEGLPAETTAGWNLVTFTNSVTATGDPFDDAWSLDFILLPEGMTTDDVVAAFGAAFGGPPEGEASPVAMEDMEMATPAGMEMATPAGAPEDPLAFLYETYLAGGPGALQGETTTAAIYLQPGDYAVFSGIGGAVTLTVTGEADAASPVASGVTADATITETGTSGSFDFMAASLPTGPAVIEIVNESDQPHFIFAVHSDVPFTEDEVIALLEEDESATPEAGAAAEPPVAPGFITGTQSPSTTQYVAADLEPGYYILLCFVGDPMMGGVPHSFAGMIEVVPSGDAAATPAA